MPAYQAEIFPAAPGAQVEKPVVPSKEHNPIATPIAETVDTETGEVKVVEAEQPAEKTSKGTRKRRTKAEIQAERESKAIETVQAMQPENPEPDIKEQDIFIQLAYIQQHVKAPKRLLSNSSDSAFPYRSFESIIEDTRELVHNICGCSIVADKVSTPIEVGGRIAVNATVALVNNRGQRFESMAPVILDFAQSSSAPQAMGAAISYARKYALNGLLALDDARTEAVTEPDSSMAGTQKPEQKKQQRQVAATPAKPSEPKPVQAATQAESKPAQPQAAENAPKPQQPKNDPHEVQVKEKLTATSPAWSACIATAAVFNGTGEELVKQIRAKFEVEEPDLRMLCAIAGKEFPATVANS